MKIWNQQFRNLHLFLLFLFILGFILGAWQYSVFIVCLTAVIWIIAFLYRKAE